jgi:hypothetical protein
VIATAAHSVVNDGLVQVAAGVISGLVLFGLTYLIGLARKARKAADVARDAALDAKIAAAMNARAQHEHEQTLEYVAAEVGDVKSQVTPNGGDSTKLGDTAQRTEQLLIEHIADDEKRFEALGINGARKAPARKVVKKAAKKG